MQKGVNRGIRSILRYEVVHQLMGSRLPILYLPILCALPMCAQSAGGFQSLSGVKSARSKTTDTYQRFAPTVQVVGAGNGRVGDPKQIVFGDFKAWCPLSGTGQSSTWYADVQATGAAREGAAWFSFGGGYLWADSPACALKLGALVNVDLVNRWALTGTGLCEIAGDRWRAGGLFRAAGRRASTSDPETRSSSRLLRGYLKATWPGLEWIWGVFGCDFPMGEQVRIPTRNEMGLFKNPLGGYLGVELYLGKGIKVFLHGQLPHVNLKEKRSADWNVRFGVKGVGRVRSQARRWQLQGVQPGRTNNLCSDPTDGFENGQFLQTLSNAKTPNVPSTANPPTATKPYTYGEKNWEISTTVLAAGQQALLTINAEASRSSRLNCRAGVMLYESKPYLPFQSFDLKYHLGEVKLAIFPYRSPGWISVTREDARTGESRIRLGPPIACLDVQQKSLSRILYGVQTQLVEIFNLNPLTDKRLKYFEIRVVPGKNSDVKGEFSLPIAIGTTRALQPNQSIQMELITSDSSEPVQIYEINATQQWRPLPPLAFNNALHQLSVLYLSNGQAQEFIPELRACFAFNPKTYPEGPHFGESTLTFAKSTSNLLFSILENDEIRREVSQQAHPLFGDLRDLSDDTEHELCVPYDSHFLFTASDVQSPLFNGVFRYVETQEQISTGQLDLTQGKTQISYRPFCSQDGTLLDATTPLCRFYAETDNPNSISILPNNWSAAMKPSYMGPDPLSPTADAIEAAFESVRSLVKEKHFVPVAMTKEALVRMGKKLGTSLPSAYPTVSNWVAWILNAENSNLLEDTSKLGSVVAVDLLTGNTLTVQELNPDATSGSADNLKSVQGIVAFRLKPIHVTDPDTTPPDNDPTPDPPSEDDGSENVKLTVDVTETNGDVDEGLPVTLAWNADQPDNCLKKIELLDGLGMIAEETTRANPGSEVTLTDGQKSPMTYRIYPKGAKATFVQAQLTCQDGSQQLLPLLSFSKIEDMTAFQQAYRTRLTQELSVQTVLQTPTSGDWNPDTDRFFSLQVEAISGSRSAVTYPSGGVPIAIVSRTDPLNPDSYKNLSVYDDATGNWKPLTGAYLLPALEQLEDRHAIAFRMQKPDQPFDLQAIFGFNKDDPTAHPGACVPPTLWQEQAALKVVGACEKADLDFKDVSDTPETSLYIPVPYTVLLQADEKSDPVKPSDIWREVESGQTLEDKRVQLLGDGKTCSYSPVTLQDDDTLACAHACTAWLKVTAADGSRARSFNPALGRGLKFCFIPSDPDKKMRWEAVDGSPAALQECYTRISEKCSAAQLTIEPLQKEELIRMGQHLRLFDPGSMEAYFKMRGIEMPEDAQKPEEISYAWILGDDGKSLAGPFDAADSCVAIDLHGGKPLLLSDLSIEPKPGESPDLSQVKGLMVFKLSKSNA